MNDVYVGVFILAAYLRVRVAVARARAATLGVLDADADRSACCSASRWRPSGWRPTPSAPSGILILVRSALGRLLLIFGMIGLTGVLGWMAMAVPAGSGASGNLLFTLIMIALTLATVVVTVYHPIAWSDEEMWFAVGRRRRRSASSIAFGSIVLGKAGNDRSSSGPVQFTPLEVGVRVRRRRAASRTRRSRSAADSGSARWRRRRTPDDPRRPACRPRRRRATAGCGWARASASRSCGWSARLLAIPLVVYVISYIPWAFDRGPPARRGLAGRPHGPDAARPHRRDVPVPQRPDRGAPGELAVVGLAAEPQAGLVLPGQLRRTRPPPRSTTPAT